MMSSATQNIPGYCLSEVKIDSKNAMWYVPNSVRVSDIVPVWTTSGGGRTKDSMFNNIEDAISQAKVYRSDQIRAYCIASFLITSTVIATLLYYLEV